MMYDATVVAAVIAAAASIAAAFISAANGRRQHEAELSLREREMVDVATEKVRIAMMDGQELTLLALKGEHMDGNVDAALEKLRSVRSDYEATCAIASRRL